METKLKKAPAYRFGVFFIMLVPYTLVYMGIQIIASLGGDIMAEYRIGESALSLLSSLGTITKALFALAGGVLIGRIGGKRTIVLGRALMGLSGVLYMTAGVSYGAVCAVRLLQGVGSGIVSCCATPLMCAWFPRHERGMAQGTLSCFFSGAIPIVTVYSFFCTERGLNWRNTAGLLLAVCGFVMAALVLLLFRDVKQVYGVDSIDEVLELPAAEKTASVSVSYEKPKNWSEALRFPGFWLSCMMAFFYCACNFGIGFVMPLFLTSCGYAEETATTVMTLGTVGGLLSGLAGGILSDKVFSSRRSDITAISFLGGAVLFLPLMLLGGRLSPGLFTVLYFVAYAVTTCACGPAWVIPLEIVDPSFAARCNSVCILFSGIGGFVATNLLGIAIEHWGMLSGLLLTVFCTAMTGVSGVLLKKKYQA